MIFPEINYSEWKTIFQRSFVVTRETRLHSFQYKIIHQIIMCQKKLFQITISDSPNCVVCDQIDDLTHFLIQCRYVQIFWTELFKGIQTVRRTMSKTFNIFQTINPIFNLKILEESLNSCASNECSFRNYNLNLTLHGCFQYNRLFFTKIEKAFLILRIG